MINNTKARDFNENTSIEKTIRKILAQYKEMNWSDIDSKTAFMDIDIEFSFDEIVDIIFLLEDAFNLPLGPKHLVVKDFESIYSLKQAILSLLSMYQN